MFCGGFTESADEKIEIPITDDIQPEAFRVFLRWLYGQPLEKATESILRKKEDFTGDNESYETYYLDFLVHLLKITDIYGVEPLKDKVEDTIINSTQIGVQNVCQILVWSKD